jgi:hypothetical protein
VSRRGGLTICCCFRRVPVWLTFFASMFVVCSWYCSVSVVTAHDGGGSSSGSVLQLRVPFNSSIVATKQHIAIALQQQQQQQQQQQHSGNAWSVAEMQLEFKGIVLPDSSTLDLCGIGDGSTVMLARATYVRQQPLKTRVAASQNKSRGRSRAEEEQPPLDANAIRQIVKESVVETVREIETHTVQVVRSQLEGGPHNPRNP